MAARKAQKGKKGRPPKRPSNVTAFKPKSLDHGFFQNVFTGLSENKTVEILKKMLAEKEQWWISDAIERANTLKAQVCNFITNLYLHRVAYLLPVSVYCLFLGALHDSSAGGAR